MIISTSNILSSQDDSPSYQIDIFKISEIITRQYLRIGSNSPFIEEHGYDILKRLECFYTKEGCIKDKNGKAEKDFLLRSLPLMSSVIQLSTSIKNFDDAMEQLEKIYNLKEMPFKQASKLSYLVFLCAIEEGNQKYCQDKELIEYNVSYFKTSNVETLPAGTYSFQSRTRDADEGTNDSKIQVTNDGTQLVELDNGNFQLKWGDKSEVQIALRRSIRRRDLWKEMRDQIEVLLQEELELPELKKDQEFYWYKSAKDYAQIVNSYDSKVETNNDENYIERVTNKAIQKLKQAIEINSEYKEMAKTEEAFNPIKDNSDFKKLISE